MVAFDQRSEELALALGRRPGIALENALLYDEIRVLFEGFVDASVTAIESRDPTTSGHSRRVATLSVELAKKVDARRPTGRWRTSTSRPLHLQQLEYAGVLHDFGKVGVREQVLVKAKKLYEEDLRNIKLRFAYIKKGLEAEHAERKLRVALELGKSDLAARFAAHRRRAGAADGRGRRARWRSSPASTSRRCWRRAGSSGWSRSRACVYLAPDGELRPYLEPEEVAALQVRRGSLTEVERVEIERHVVHTTSSCRRSRGAAATPTCRASPPRTTSI